MGLKDFKKFPYNYFPTCLGGEGKRGKEDFPPYELFFFEGIPKCMVYGYFLINVCQFMLLFMRIFRLDITLPSCSHSITFIGYVINKKVI